jgi:glycosyltransferase involved in cell wall biosynthesis
MLAPSLVVFSHVRWGAEVQRPQHLMRRLAGRWRVLFIEEPVQCEGPAHLQVHEPAAGLTVLVPHTPAAAAGFHDDQIALLEPLLADHWQQHPPAGPSVAWLYTPMALPLVPTFRPACVVYDCMDELAAFKNAPRQMRQRESALLARAAVVFTGGPSLFEAKRHLHAQVVCIPGSVDPAHFAPTRLQAGSEPQRRSHALQGALPRPRLGYFGVIDERVDLHLIATLADTHPHWQIVMAGQVVGLDPRSLPRRANIHWLGRQAYDCLPHLMAGWDLCLLPFVLNDATRHLNPPQAMEYMAGSKPVVGTPIEDVVSLYGHAVEVARGAGAFMRACEAVLAEGAAARGQRALRMLTTVFMHSWDRSADTVHQLADRALAQALQEPLARAARAAADRATA